MVPCAQEAELSLQTVLPCTPSSSLTESPFCSGSLHSPYDLGVIPFVLPVTESEMSTWPSYSQRGLEEGWTASGKQIQETPGRSRALLRFVLPGGSHLHTMKGTR